ncbi:MAG: phosphoribosylaminoimidazolesuccinocarboxamide synthase, partial [Gemmobacter sp.]
MPPETDDLPEIPLPEAIIPELPGLSRGKVRDSYDVAPDRRILIASDRLSAFDRILAVIPG